MACAALPFCWCYFSMHYSNAWINNLPYRDEYDHITLFHLGRYGVQLFRTVDKKAD